MQGKTIKKFIDRQGVLFLDGALATELERRGADLDDPLWSAKILLEAPELLEAVHRDYYEAGADVGTTASYQATLEGFTRRGIAPPQAAALIRESVRIARLARDTFWEEPANRQGRLRPLVAASVGPYGAFLADGSEYRGNYSLSRKALTDWHRPRLELLVEEGPDLLAFETIPCLKEAEAIVRLLEEFPGVEAWLSFSCCDAASLCNGDPFAEAAALAESAGKIVAMGVNCTPPSLVVPLLHLAKAETQKYLLAYPNSGEAWDAGRHCWTDAGETADLPQLAPEWQAAGATIIGGCCRTRPADIQSMRSIIAAGGIRS